MPLSLGGLWKGWVSGGDGPLPPSPNTPTLVADLDSAATHADVLRAMRRYSASDFSSGAIEALERTGMCLRFSSHDWSEILEAISGDDENPELSEFLRGRAPVRVRRATA